MRLYGVTRILANGQTPTFRIRAISGAEASKAADRLKAVADGIPIPGYKAPEIADMRRIVRSYT